jgi:hypothetical protein
LGELWNQNFGMLVNLESSVFKTRIFTITFHNETFTEFLGEDTIWTAHLQIKHNFSHHYIVCLAHCECTILEKITEIDYLAAFSMYIHLNQHSWSEFHKLFPLNKKLAPWPMFTKKNEFHKLSKVEGELTFIKCLSFWTAQCSKHNFWH